MTIRLGSNVASLTAQRKLADGTAALAKTFERLSSGQRINRASDDAAGLSIADSLRADTRVFNQAVRNINDGISVLAIAQGALAQLTSITTRQLELAEQAANGVYSLVQRRALDTEANALVDEFNRIVEAVEFNGLKLLDSLTELRIQAGKGIEGSIAFAIGDELARTVGDGTFGAPISIAVGDIEFGRPTVGDLNADSHDDLVISEQSSGQVRVMLGIGDGTFQPGMLFSAATVIDTQVIDINGDGKSDVVGTAPSPSSRVSVLLGNGDGTLRAVSTYLAGDTSHILEVVDVNGDSYLDVVTADREDSTLSILLGNGDGTFRARTTIATPDKPVGLAAADLNGDQVIDLAAAMQTQGSVQILLGAGDGTFQQPLSMNTNAGVHDKLRSGDLDGDGFQDLVASVTSDNSVRVLLGRGDGTFQPSISYATTGGSTPVDLEIVDLTGDGLLDVAVAT